MRGSEIENEHIKNVEWAISLSQANFDRYRAGDWLNLKEEMYDFLYGSDLWSRLGRAPIPKRDKSSADKNKQEKSPYADPDSKEAFLEEAQPAELREIRSVLKEMLQQVTANEDINLSVPQSEVWLLSDDQKAHFAPVFWVDSDRKVLAGLNLILHMSVGRTSRRWTTLRGA